MNVSTAQASTAPAGAQTAPREPATAATPASGDEAGFIAVLLQVASTNAPASLAQAASGAQDPDDAPTGETLPATPDWVTPFLVPATPTPIDHELPAGEPSPDGPEAVLRAAPGIVAVDAGDAGDADAAARPGLQVDDGDGKLPLELNARSTDVTRPPLHGLEHVAASTTRVESPPNGAVVRAVPVPVTDHRWPGRVAHEVRLLVADGVQHATLRLNPEHLGPVDVQIDVVNDRANVTFGASHADTRAALTEAIPKLREMFAGAGLTLGDAGVRQDAPRDPPQTSRPGIDGHLDADDEATRASRAGLVQVGLVDAYA